jgi:hypothetical protein
MCCRRREDDRLRPEKTFSLCLAFTASVRGGPEDHSPSAVEIEVYCADLRPGDDSTRQAFDLWLDLRRHGKAAPFEPARLVCRKRYAVQDSCEFDARERFEPAFATAAWLNGLWRASTAVNAETPA